MRVTFGGWEMDRTTLVAWIVSLLAGVQLIAILFVLRRLDRFGAQRLFIGRKGRRQEQGGAGSASPDDSGEAKRSHGGESAASEAAARCLKVAGTSSIVQSREEWDLLCEALPRRFQLSTAVRLFSTEEDGVSLQTFCAKLGDKTPTLLLLEDSDHGRFGAYCTGSWPKATEMKPVGTGESFVFRFCPDFQAFPWSRANRIYQTRSAAFLAVGGGGKGNALRVDAEFHHGVSTQCETYGNPTLAKTERFHCLRAEAWSL